MKIRLPLLVGLTLATGGSAFHAEVLPGAQPALASPAAIRSATAGADTALEALSADGRFAVLAGAASDLTSDPNPGIHSQLYLRDNVSGRVMLVSATPTGAAGNGNSGRAAVSAEGRWVAFESEASDLVAGDANSRQDIFLRDVANGRTWRLSQGPDGTASSGPSEGPVMPADGAWVAFTSLASNLVAGVTDANRAPDVFLYERATGRLRLVSRPTQAAVASATGASEPVAGPNGQWLAFTSADGLLAPGAPTDTSLKLFLHHVAGETNLWASRDAAAFEALVPPSSQREPRHATFSADGGFLTYTYGPLVLRLDLANGQTRLLGSNFVAEVATTFGRPRPALSTDGSICAWPGGPREGDVLPGAPDAIYAWDETTQATTRVQPPLSDPAVLGEVGRPVLSADGEKLAFVAHLKLPDPSGLTAGWHWFLHDRRTGQTVPVTLAGAPLPELWSPHWTADLRVLAFSSAATNLVPEDLNRAQDAFALDVTSGQLTLLSPAASGTLSTTPIGGSEARGQCFSADGRYLVFTSSAADLVANDRNGVEDVFVRDLHTGVTVLVSVDRSGTGSGNGASLTPVISADGRYVAFASQASNLVDGDTNGQSDIFVRDLVAGTTQLVSHAHGGTGSANGASHQPAMSADGRWIAFESNATNLLAPEMASVDVNGGMADVFVFDRQTGTIQPVSIRTDGARTGEYSSTDPVITPDGRFVLFQSRSPTLVSPPASAPGLAYSDKLLYLRDLSARTTTLLLNPEGKPYIVSGADSRPVVVSADSSTLAVATRLPAAGVAVHRLDGQWVAQVINAASPALSGDGSLLAYATPYQNDPSGGQVFLRHLSDGATRLVSVSLDGVNPGNGRSSQPVLSADGRYVVFQSQSSDLVPRDPNECSDVFVRDLAASRTLLLSGLPSGAAPHRGAASPVLAPDGRTVAFLSWTDELAPGDRNHAGDVFVLRLGSGPAADSDEDGLPDDWEVAYFNGLMRDGAEDWDGDGLSDRAEYRFGTDPTNAGSVLRVLTLTGAGTAEVTVVWGAIPGRTYRVQFKDRLEAPWTDLPGDVTASSETASKTDATAGASLARFYRAVLLQ